MRDLMILTAGATLGLVVPAAVVYGRRVHKPTPSTADDMSTSPHYGGISWGDRKLEDVLEEAAAAAKLDAFQREVFKGALWQLYTKGVGDGLEFQQAHPPARRKGQ